MINVMSFAWHVQNAVRVDQPMTPVEMLIDVADARRNAHPEKKDRAFVLTDTTCWRSVLVAPSALRWAVEHGIVHRQDPIKESGFLDFLGCGQVVVAGDRPASAVAYLLKETTAGVALVVSPTLEAVGLFVPASIAERLPRASMFSQGSSRTRVLVQSALGVGDLPAAIATIESDFADFHSELLNFANPEETFCQGGGGHSVAQCPCPQHPGAACTRLEIG
jgi:hypothetical protein